jgi:hypothetical protein
MNKPSRCKHPLGKSISSRLHFLCLLLLCLLSTGIHSFRMQNWYKETGDSEPKRRHRLEKKPGSTSTWVLTSLAKSQDRWEGWIVLYGSATGKLDSVQYTACTARTASEGPVKIHHNCLSPIYDSQKWNCYFQNIIIMFCLPVLTLIHLWEIYIFQGSVCLFCCWEYVDQSWEYINHSQTHECGNLDWSHEFPEREYINGIFLAVRPTRTALLSAIAVSSRCVEGQKGCGLLGSMRVRRGSMVDASAWCTAVPGSISTRHSTFVSAGVCIYQSEQEICPGRED